MAPLSHSAAHSAAKAAHYKANLGAALVRGAWTDATPGAAPNGSGLSWSELIRKWGKHTGGNTALVHQLRNVSLIDLNSAHHVRTQIGSSASSGDGASGSASSYVHVPAAASGNVRTAANGANHTHSQSRSTLVSASGHPGPGSAGASAAASRPAPPHADGEDGACCHSWVRGSHWGRTLEGPNVDEIRQGVNLLESVIQTTPAGDPARLSATLTLAYHLYALGDHDGALAIYDQFDWRSNPTAGVVEGDAAVVERIRARTFQGICREISQHQVSSSRALEVYLEAIKLLSKLQTPVALNPTYLQPEGTNPAATKSSVPTLEAHRELLRHVSTALTRAAVIAARGTDTQFTLSILRTYHALAASWAGSTFRFTQRQRMMSLYLAALQSTYPASGATAQEPYLLTGGSPSRSARATWRAEVHDAMRIGQRMLSDTTSFPKAGDVNEAVTEFTNQVALFPDLAPSTAPEVISILWWGTTLTFQSQSILRHLVRLLSTTSSADKTEARRTFELYVQLVVKSRLSNDPDSPLKLERHPTETEEEEVVADDVVVEREHVELETSMDTDEQFASTLLIGAELLLSAFDDSEEAWRYATLAGDVVKHGHGVSPKLAAKVEECKGIVRLAMSTSVAGPAKRPVYQAQAISHLRASTVLDPTSSEAFYHLAYGHAIARQIDPAVDAVRSALELNSQSVRAWHLLALLFTAQGDWHAAARAGETGVALWDSDDEAIAADEADAAGEAAAVSGPHPLILPSGELVPPEPSPARRQSRFTRLETVIELRKTLNVIAEKLHGPEVALERHQQLFAFFSQRTETRGGTRSAAPSDAGSPHSNPPADLGDSYVLTRPADVHVSPPSPIVVTGALTPPAAGTPSAPTSPSDNSAPPSDAEGSGGRLARGGSHKKGIFPKHLHVPSVARQPSNRALSAAQATMNKQSSGSRSTSSPALLNRERAASQSTVALSIAPTAVHSHYRGARGSIPAPPPPLKKTTRRPPAEERILSDLWLLSAASFRRAGKHGQALVAIEEAENHDPENPNVWVQLGLLQMAEYGADSTASDAPKALTKALLLKPDYPPAVVCMARLNLAQGDLDLAHSLLWQLTEDKGWDVPEAWLTLATTAEKQGRALYSRECLLEALRLEKSRTCRALGDALKVW